MCRTPPDQYYLRLEAWVTNLIKGGQPKAIGATITQRFVTIPSYLHLVPGAGQVITNVASISRSR